jgi:hypothetical protein
MTLPDQVPKPDRHYDSDPPSSLAGLMAPMQCVMHGIDDGHELRLSGVAIDRILPLLAGSGYEDASNLLVGFDPELPANAMQPTGHVPGPRRLSDDLLQHIAWIARIEGPVEDGDAHALHQAWERRSCLLAAELRANLSVIRGVNGVLILRTGDQDVLLHAAGELLREHVHRATGRSLHRIAAPDAGLMHAFLSISGTMSLRPIETQSYSTWIDVGISTCTSRSIRPADCSVIYDTVGNSWHGDP